MVTTAVMSQFPSGKIVGNTSGQDYGSIFSSGFQHIANHDPSSDNPSSPLTPSVHQGLAASAATEEDQVRSPVSASHTAHHFYYLPPTAQESAGLKEARSLDEESHDESSFEDPHVHTDSSLPLQNQHPTSPMVTPPARTYQNANTSRTPYNFSNSPKSPSKKSGRIMSKDSRPVYSHPMEGVPHVYHDYSQLPHDEETYIRKKTGGVTQPFPEKLHEMLLAVEGTDKESIVSWLPHGRAFIVRKPKEFTDIIMPNFFKQTKLTSFQRQLNLYGFRRLTQGVDAGAYYHEMFLRIRPGLCMRMTRQKVKGTGHKQPADVRTEPNFYQMSSGASLPSPQATTDNVAQHYFGSFESAVRQETSQPIDVPLPFVKGTFEKISGGTGTPSLKSMVPNSSSSAWGFAQQDRMVADAVDTVIHSPMSPGLHGAAHLLQGIASGFMNPSLRMPSSDALPPPVLERSGTQEQEALPRPSNDESRYSTCFLQPRLSNDECR